MKTNDKGQFVRYWVSPSGIEEITESHEMWPHSYEEPIFDTFEDAANFAITVLFDRVKELEKKNGK